MRKLPKIEELKILMNIIYEPKGKAREYSGSRPRDSAESLKIMTAAGVGSPH